MKSRPESSSRTTGPWSSRPPRPCSPRNPPEVPRSEYGAAHRHHHLRARAARRVRGHQQGPSDPAHPADVRGELDPRHRPGGRHAHRGHREQRARLHPRLRGRRLRRHERRRRLRRHRADAQDVPAQPGTGARSGHPGRGQRPAHRRPGMNTFDWVTQLLYVASAVCFVLGLHLMNSPASARRGNQVSTAGMALAIATTFALVVHAGTVTTTGWIVMIAGVLVGAGAGLYSARTVQMTAMPQLVSLFNAVGGGAAALIAVHDYVRLTGATAGLPESTTITTILDVLIGAVTFSGSIIAAGKLQGVINAAPVTFRGSRAANIAAAVVAVGGGIYMVATPSVPVMIIIILAALAFGVTMVMPIGGADMPVVISLLNAFTGTAVAMAGFVIGNWALIIAGALVGASGGILTKLMADAMNRSLANIIIGGFGTGDSAAAVEGPGGDVRPIAADDAAIQLAYAQKVIIVPGYGLAAAHAQHQLAELAKELENHGIEVSYAIHPVAGRMPGHMNVLLAEANVPYPQLKEMDDINPEFPRADVALVVGANDVTNPAARRPGNAVSGMPILDVDQAKSIIVVKRSMGTGYAGIDNELYVNPKTSMFFADAKSALTELTAAVKTLVG